MSVYAREMLFHLEDVAKFRQEPFIDISYLPDLVNAIASVKSRRNRKDTLVRWINEFLVDVFDKVVLRTGYHKHAELSRPTEQTFANPEN
jgi:hypothetical protein